MARELAEELDRRGAALILSLVPYGNTRTGHLPFLARELGVPVVLPSFDRLVTADGSHLARSSAESYAKAFWSQLLALPECWRQRHQESGWSSVARFRHWAPSRLAVTHQELAESGSAADTAS